MTFSSAPSGVFIAGTDTGIGKTRVSCALIRRYVAQGLRAVGMKPVLTGANADWDDAAIIDRAGNVEAPLAARNPFAFAPAIAPHLAARAAGRAIELAAIVRAYRGLQIRADRIVVEAAGGVLVPLDSRCDMLDIPVALGIPVVLVVGVRLGAINHALLSALAIRGRGVAFTGWVANVLDPAFDADATIQAIAERLAEPRLATLAYGEADGPRWTSAASAL